MFTKFLSFLLVRFDFMPAGKENIHRKSPSPLADLREGKATIKCSQSSNISRRKKQPSDDLIRHGRGIPCQIPSHLTQFRWINISASLHFYQAELFISLFLFFTFYMSKWRLSMLDLTDSPDSLTLSQTFLLSFPLFPIIHYSYV